MTNSVISVFDFIPSNMHAAIIAGTSTTDSSVYVQQAIDEALYKANDKGGAKVVMPAGVYYWTNGVNLGYGQEYCTPVLEGETGEGQYRAEGLKGGVAILADFDDQPVISVSGTRGGHIKGIGIRGVKNYNGDTQSEVGLFNHIRHRNLGSVTEQPRQPNNGPIIDDTLELAWEDPNLTSQQDNRYAPFCGIAIDPRLGGVQSHSYRDAITSPGITLPSQYNWPRASSFFTIEDCYIGGVTVGVMNHSNNQSGNNGDFLHTIRCRVEHCKHAFSAGDTQGRNWSIRDCTVHRVFNVLTNAKHGMQQGKFGGSVDNLSVTDSINLLDLIGIFAEPLVFTNLYAEALYRLGRIKSTSENERTIKFIGGEVSFNSQGVFGRPVPAQTLEGGGQTMNLDFDGMDFTNFPSVMMIDHKDVSLRGVTMRPRGSSLEASRPQLFQKFAHNMLCGGLVLSSLNRGVENSMKRIAFNLDGNGNKKSENTISVKNSNRSFCVPLYVERVQATGENDDTLQRPIIGVDYLDKQHSINTIEQIGSSNLIRVTFDGNRKEGRFVQAGPNPGDVVFDEKTSTVLFCKYRDGQVIELEVQNNYRETGNGQYELLSQIDGGGTPHTVLDRAGYFRVVNSRVYSPDKYVFADFIEGNATLANISAGDGSTNHWDSTSNSPKDILIGDHLVVNERRERMISPTYAKINGQTANTITMSGPVSRSAERKRIEYLIRND